MAITKDLAALLSQQMDSGASNARVTFGNKSQAFAWAGDRLNATIAYVDTAVSESSTFNATLVSYEADVAAWTSGTKTDTATVSIEAQTLSTYPGAVEVTTKQIMDSTGLGAAINLALYGQALRALDAALITDLLGTVPTVDAAADLANIATAQAGLMADGYSPNLCVVSPTLYASLAGGSLLVGSADPGAQAQSVLGARLLVSSALTGAKAIVLDSTAVVAVEHAQSPVVLMQTNARLNTLDVVVEVVGGWVIAKPQGVASVFDSTP